jgi:large subunit ribosomal protein L7/L12
MADKPKKTKTSPKLAKIIEEIGKLSVLELNDLVKALEDKFDISAIPVAAPAAAPANDGAGKEKAEEQTTFNVVLTEAGSNKIQTIKTLREIDQNLGLKEAKDLADSAPKEILTGVNKETAEQAKKKLEGAGAKVELK